MGKIIKYWNRFFFEPISAATLGLFRIVFGLIVTVSLIGKLPDRELFYGRDAIISIKTAESFFHGIERPLNLFHLVPDQDPGLLIFMSLLIVTSVFLILGLFSRVSSILVWIGLTALSNRNFLVDNSGDDLMRILSFFLIFAPSGSALSLDRALKKILSPSSASNKWALITPWAFRLMQLQLAYVYLDTFYLKLYGASWRDGTAVYYAFHYIEMQRFNSPWGRAILGQLWEIKLVTWATLAIEGAMGILIWFKPLRYWILGSAFLLHLGINLMLQFPVFQYVMMAGLTLFIEPREVTRAYNKFIGRVLQ